MTDRTAILWVDDEVELLKAHLLFLEQKGYDVTPVSNGDDALRLVRDGNYDLVLLDESMPGKDGMQTLKELREINGTIPVVMVTKNEEEAVMEQAIGRRADDYLIKPVNPSQILVVIRRIIEQHSIGEKQMAQDYVAQYRELDPAEFVGLDHENWVQTYLRMIRWDMQLDKYRNTGLGETHDDQHRTANQAFSRYVETNYREWVQRRQGPDLSPDVFGKYVFPRLQAGARVAFLVVDCMRLDQWIAMEALLEPYFRIQRQHYYGILPSATPYARNALFAGLMPLEIAQQYPQYWQSTSESSLNRHESELMEAQLQRLGASPKLKTRYLKVYNPDDAKKLFKALHKKSGIDLFGLVFNFIDVLTHGRSESAILQEIAPDEAAFRTLARSWFEHSSLLETFKRMAQHGIEVIVTTDHGSVLGLRPTLATGNRDTSTTVRYKYGENLGFDEKGAFKMQEPEDYMLPKWRSTMNFIIAKENFYFVYPTKYRHYEKQFHGSFQHGGVSLEEIILPVAHLVPRS